MTYIYGKAIDGVDGVLCNPAHKSVIADATLVYADDEAIVKNYKDAGIEVQPLTPKKTSSRKKATKE